MRVLPHFSVGLLWATLFVIGCKAKRLYLKEKIEQVEPTPSNQYGAQVSGLAAYQARNVYGYGAKGLPDTMGSYGPYGPYMPYLPPYASFPSYRPYFYNGLPEYPEPQPSLFSSTQIQAQYQDDYYESDSEDQSGVQSVSDLDGYQQGNIVAQQFSGGQKARKMDLKENIEPVEPTPTEQDGAPTPILEAYRAGIKLDVDDDYLDYEEKGDEIGFGSWNSHTGQAALPSSDTEKISELCELCYELDSEGSGDSELCSECFQDYDPPAPPPTGVPVPPPTATLHINLIDQETEPNGQQPIDIGKLRKDISGGFCRSSFCKNGGTCLLTPAGDDFHCLCRDGWKGSRCGDWPSTPPRKKGLCRSNTCKNMGTCYQTPAGDNFKCVCADGWEGSRCGVRKSTARTQAVSSSFLPEVPEYTYRSNQYCTSFHGNYYSTLEEAKTACDADSNCMGFNDYRCNGSQYRLCSLGGSWSSQSGVCGYERLILSLRLQG